jgi:phage-related minor tail protein
MGYDSFGLKIGIEGEREFKNALKEINQSFKVLGSEMNLVTSQFDKQDKSIQAITARNNVLNKEIEAQEICLKNGATRILSVVKIDCKAGGVTIEEKIRNYR